MYLDYALHLKLQKYKCTVLTSINYLSIDCISGVNQLHLYTASDLH